MLQTYEDESAVLDMDSISSKELQSSVTCNHLPPALIQVRGNHVPHGYRRASQIQQIPGLVTRCTQMENSF